MRSNTGHVNIRPTCMQFSVLNLKEKNIGHPNRNTTFTEAGYIDEIHHTIISYLHEIKYNAYTQTRAPTNTDLQFFMHRKFY